MMISLLLVVNLLVNLAVNQVLGLVTILSGFPDKKCDKLRFIRLAKEAGNDIESFDDDNFAVTQTFVDYKRNASKQQRNL